MTFAPSSTLLLNNIGIKSSVRKSRRRDLNWRPVMSKTVFSCLKWSNNKFKSSYTEIKYSDWLMLVVDLKQQI